MGKGERRTFRRKTPNLDLQMEQQFASLSGSQRGLFGRRGDSSIVEISGRLEGRGRVDGSIEGKGEDEDGNEDDDEEDDDGLSIFFFRKKISKEKSGNKHEVWGSMAFKTDCIKEERRSGQRVTFQNINQVDGLSIHFNRHG